jgi:hypothetical protein
MPGRDGRPRAQDGCRHGKRRVRLLPGAAKLSCAPDSSCIIAVRLCIDLGTIMVYAIKAQVVDPRAMTFEFIAQKTMYGGKRIATGDVIFVFASENEGGQGLIARGIVTQAKAIPKKPGIARQTPRVSVTIKRTALAKRSMGRSELKHLTDWKDGRPGTELNFKFYRQATNKIVGLSDRAASFLSKCF